MGVALIITGLLTAGACILMSISLFREGHHRHSILVLLLIPTATTPIYQQHLGPPAMIGIAGYSILVMGVLHGLGFNPNEEVTEGES